MIERTPEFELANKIINNTNRNLFLTGKAGTGKTTFLKFLKETCDKRMVVVAPTGVAAINAGGMTIHSFFQIKFGPFVPNQSKSPEIQKIRKEKIKIIRTLDLLVIDEISMVRADLLDAVDEVLRRIRRNNLPFGGIQLLMIGDTQQLTPVVKEEEWELLQYTYETPYFFSSTALRKVPFSCVELKTVFRQDDAHFIDLLNKIRDNKFDQSTLDELNQRYQPNFKRTQDDGYIQLTTHNRVVQHINEQGMNELKGSEHTFEAKITGNFPEGNYPTDAVLSLKEGAQIMFIKNDSSVGKKYYNGKIGYIKSIKDEAITVVDKQTHEETSVGKEVWENIKYTINLETNEIEEEVEGTFEQIPIKPAWAITIHKSQGLTFEKAIIDAQSSFSHGQVYVALSRCKTLEGMILSTPLSMNSIKHDRRVEHFNQEAEQLVPSDNDYERLEKEYYLQLLEELISVKDLCDTFIQTHRLVYHHLASTYPTLLKKMDDASISIHNEIEEVAEKFTLQINQICENEPQTYAETINKRLQKGANYFIQKCQDIILPILNDLETIEIDNKEVAIQYNDLKQQLNNSYDLKVCTLENCKQGFTIKSYLKCKNECILNERTAKREKISTPPSEVTHTELFERLRQWRLETSNAFQLPAYVIMQQKTLIDICNHLPSNEKELAKISGFGTQRIKKYGKEILTIIEECVIQYDYKRDPSIFGKDENLVKEPVKKQKTQEITYQLYEQGNSIDKIAEVRGLSSTTIESHFVDLIKDNKIDLSVITNQSRLDILKTYIEGHPNLSSKEIIESLKNEYSYNELKLAKWQMEQDKK